MIVNHAFVRYTHKTEGDDPVKKTLTRILLLAAALVLAMSLCLAHAEEPAEEAAVSTTAFLFWQDADWWPAVTRNRDEYWTPITATVTGEGYYTVGVQGHMPSWFYSGGNHNCGAQKLAVIIEDGSVLFPGYYMQITDIRINGVSYPCGDVTYGQTGYESAAEDGSLFWDADDAYGLIYDQWQIDNNGSLGGGTWRSAGVAQKFDVFDVSLLDDPGSIEIDFFLSAQQDVKPAGGPALRVIGKGPEANVNVVPLSAQSELQLDAWIQFADSDWWPSHNDAESGNGVELTKAVVTGEGSYTVAYDFNKDWNGGVGAVGAQRMMVIVQDGYAQLPGYYMQVTSIRADGEEIPLVGSHGFGPVGYDTDFGADADDAYAILYDQYRVDVEGSTLPWGHLVWDGTEGTSAAIDPNSLTGQGKLEVDFIITDAAGEQPEVPVYEYDYKWYPDNTMGLAGISLRDKGITDKWYNVVPVKLSENGIYEIPLAASNLFLIGTASVAVQDGQATVTYDTYGTPASNLFVGNECVKWFGSIEEITDEFCDAPTSDIAFGEAVDVSGLGEIGYLFICNRVTYSQPLANNGQYLPGYRPNTSKVWADYRAQLEDLIASAAQAAPAEEVPAE